MTGSIVAKVEVYIDGYLLPEVISHENIMRSVEAKCNVVIITSSLGMPDSIIEFN